MANETPLDCATGSGEPGWNWVFTSRFVRGSIWQIILRIWLKIIARERGIRVESKPKKRLTSQEPFEQRRLVSQVVRDRMRRNQPAGVGEIVVVLHRMEAAARLWLHDWRIADNRRGSVVDVMNGPTFASPIWPPAAGNKKGHDGWAVVSLVWLRKTRSAQAFGDLCRIMMPLFTIPSRAARPEQLADLWPFKEVVRFPED